MNTLINTYLLLPLPFKGCSCSLSSSSNFVFFVVSCSRAEIACLHVLKLDLGGNLGGNWTDCLFCMLERVVGMVNGKDEGGMGLGCMALCSRMVERCGYSVRVVW